MERHSYGRKEGGPNPEANSRLRAVIQNSKAANMQGNVERAIKKLLIKTRQTIKVLFEGYALMESPS
jgi:transcriptional/translational regulatory protein YebC/TACO1